MKRTFAVIATAVVLLGSGAPVAANLVELTTSVSLTEVDDAKGLAAAIEAAVHEAVTGAIAFQPTLVALTTAQVVGGRLYVRVLVADEEGERVLGALTRPEREDGPRQVEEVEIRT